MTFTVFPSLINTDRVPFGTLRCSSVVADLSGLVIIDVGALNYIIFKSRTWDGVVINFDF